MRRENWSTVWQLETFMEREIKEEVEIRFLTAFYHLSKRSQHRNWCLLLKITRCREAWLSTLSAKFLMMMMMMDRPGEWLTYAQNPAPRSWLTSYWMYCLRHSGVMWAPKCSANFILDWTSHARNCKRIMLICSTAATPSCMTWNCDITKVVCHHAVFYSPYSRYYWHLILTRPMPIPVSCLLDLNILVHFHILLLILYSTFLLSIVPPAKHYFGHII